MVQVKRHCLTLSKYVSTAALHNFYSQQGYHLIREFPLEEKPTSREEFLEAFNIAMQLYEKQDSEVN